MKLRGAVFASVDGARSQALPSIKSLTQTYQPPTTDKVLQSRYRIVRMLGEGSFGHVYLALDLELERQVAIKVPRPERFLSPKDADGYLAEAKIVARLNHPHIVPIYDTGRTSDGVVFVVSRFIEGPTLDQHAQQQTLDTKVIVSIVRTVALALDYAHNRRLVHRDVKPANILIELETQTPYITDFGLAIREEDYAIASRGGSPAYMSPEQVRGEGHRLDGRSDLFALGVVLYELLTHKKPFIGSNLSDLFHEIIMADPIAPRELVDSIPQELERICLKALSKQASDRYPSAAAMAQELEDWLTDKPKHLLTTSAHAAIRHKGLRAYDASDAAYFLSLLPSTRESDGLPKQVSFWKHKIEETDPQKTFAVGLILGPTGCGKSSMVRAGLLPNIDDRIKTLYVEATSADTEARILNGLHKLYPVLKNIQSIDTAFASLRRSTGSKVTIVIDQFEQWLHARPLHADDLLVRALRQGDGGRVQVILMVRDDFSMAAARLMRLLDIRILEGNNFATVDLFDTSHATTVLTRFGQAFGQVPYDLTTQSDSTKQFIRQVISGLAKEGKIISVQLALFAEMVKDKPWTLATLDQVGGTDGVGVNFLEETFGSRSANPEIRLHAVAARAVLKTLLPDGSTDIKGHMRSHAELLEVTDYQHQPDDFATLLSILDGQLRLITPTEPEEQSLESKGRSADGGRSLFYQLTHDYLVPSLREWLTRKQRETPQGRAELKLAERTAAWIHWRESKQLPSLWEWLAIRRWTYRKQWKTDEAALMRQATRHHVQHLSLGTVAVLVLAMGVIFIPREVARQMTASRFNGLVRELISAEPNKIPGIVQQLDQNPQLAAVYLSPLLAQTGTTPEETQSRLHAQLASVSRDSGLTKPLINELLTGKVNYVLPLRQLLKPSAANLKDELLAILRSATEPPDRRFRVALALADYIPADDTSVWNQPELTFAVEQLVSATEHQPLLREALRPLREKLLADLERVFIDEEKSDAQRLSAANALVDYAGTDIPKLAELLTVATPDQYSVLFQKVSSSGDSAVRESLQKLTQQVPGDELLQAERIELGRRRAGAAIALLRQGERESVFDVMRVTTDPESLGQFVARCKPCGVSAKELLDCVERCDAKRQTLTAEARMLEDRVLYGLLLALGDYSIEAVDEAERPKWRDRLGQWFATDPSSTVHGATGWLLRRWGCLDQVTKVEQTPVKYDPTGKRDWFNLVLPFAPNSKIEILDGSVAAKPASVAELGSMHASQSSLPAVSPKVREAFSKAFGELTDTFGYCQGMEYDSFLMCCQELRPLGYRPTRIRPVCEERNQDGDSLVSPTLPRVSAIWKHDETPWAIEVDLSQQQMEEANRNYALTNYYPVDVAGFLKYSDQSPTVRFIGVWAKSSVAIEAELLLAVPDSSHRLEWNALEQQGLGIATRQCLLSYDDVLLHNQVWRSDARDKWQFWHSTKQFVADKMIDEVVEDFSLYEPSKAAFAAEGSIDPFYRATVLRKEPGFESKLFDYQRPSELQRNFNSLKSSGYVPVAISSAVRKGEMISSAVWRRKLDPTLVSFTFIVFPAGEYQIGSPEDEENRQTEDGETLHKVSLSRPVAICDRELTWLQFDPYDNGYTRNYWAEWSGRQLGPHDPTLGCSRYDAIAYCRWLTTQLCLDEGSQCYVDPDAVANGDPGDPQYDKIYLERSGFRLPTEAEWEVVCRSGSRSAYSFGCDPRLLKDYAWCLANSVERPHPTAQLRPNVRGLFDIHGNLLEWTHDWYAEYKGDSVDPIGPSTGWLRVCRGGCWDRIASSCRASYRSTYGAATNMHFIGFRVAMSPSAETPEASDEKVKATEP